MVFAVKKFLVFVKSPLVVPCFGIEKKLEYYILGKIMIRHVVQNFFEQSPFIHLPTYIIHKYMSFGHT